MKNQKPKISIIIPVYNVEKYLNRCLDSLLNQTFQDWIAICIDDGSTDKSGKILDKYARKDKRFTVMHIKNAGVSNARNIAIKKSCGKYIMFLDSDDCIHPQTLDIAFRFAQKHNVDIVSFGYDKCLFDDNLDNYLSECHAKKYDFNKIDYKQTDNLIKFATEKNHSFGKYKIRHCYPVVHMYKRDLIKDIRFDTNIKIAEDFPFWTSVLLKMPKGIILKTPLYFYVQRESSALNTSSFGNIFDGISLATIAAFNNVKKNKILDKWFKIWNREFLWPFIITCVRSAKNVSDKKCVKKRLIEMKKIGVFDNPPTMRARKYKHRIEKIISQIS